MVIPVSFEKLKSVVHIADVHIRLFRRHAEYEEAFEQLYTDIKSKNLEDFVIVLAGDIVHAKTDMSPEMVDVTSKFLENIADIAPTILIAGNHDCNLANTHRLDALSPIVNNLQHPNLHYIKYSGVATVADTDFAVCSILGSREDWPTPEDCNSPSKVALYHGPVHGALTDANFTITNRHVHVDTFDGFDMVMLGDIHRHQVLQELDTSNNKPVIVYASSLIQQNHGETVDGHGWCLWDIENRTFEFESLYNKYGYATLEVIDGNLQAPSRMPDNVRMRLFTGDLDTTDVKKLVTKLRRDHNIIELSVNKSRFSKQVATAGSSSPQANLDLSLPSTQNVLITDWLERNYPSLGEDTYKEIEKINIELNNQIQHDDHSRNIHWRPLNFRFSNMFSYGEDNEIEFSGMGGLYGIFAENASGKSSIADSLMFCLYDKTPRAFKGNHIMNNRKDEFSCELIFEINDEVYGIKRIGTRKKNGDVKVDVDFWKQTDSGTRLSLNGESRRDTNAVIRSYVGTYEDFIMTALSGQTDNSLFIDKSHSERKDLLIQFMGLNIFDKLYTTANDRSKEITGVLKRFSKSDTTDQISNTHDELVQLKEDLGDLEVNKELYESERRVLDSNYENLQKEIINIPSLSGNLDELELELTTSKNTLETQKKKLEDLEIDIENTTKLVEEKAHELKDYDLEYLRKVSDEYDALQLEVDKAKNEIALDEATLDSKIQLKKKLSGYDYNPECSVCVENNKTVIEDLSTVNIEIEALTDKVDTTRNHIKVTEQEVTKRVVGVNALNSANILQRDIEKLNRDLERSNSSKETLTANIQSTELKIESISKEIETYKQNENAITHNRQIESQLNVIKAEIESNKKSISSIEKQIRDTHGNISVLEAKKESLKDKLKEAEELELEYDAYSHYMLAVSRNGVPYEMITNTIPQIQAEINNILSQIVDFSVTLEVDSKNINGKLTYDYDRVWPLENSSGMERFISSLAIRVALMNVSNLPKSNFLIIDEGFGVLDAEHLHSMQTLFNLLKTQFDFILIVSHLDSARDMVDNLIEIHKEDGYSQISV